ncbi:hypothetical protein LVD15_03680 [Fulvivirga maritima]|uniref:hypothetical protein n=1 Tax=Fulvivirga maritima TaxID=2904247 RepID=UPI001F2B6192|nr:hypothetical protein [Fulvivirga maritima]UII27544.1 hypothetical protein LVD15_03680 [Fulvivirga maritima]
MEEVIKLPLSLSFMQQSVQRLFLTLIFLSLFFTVQAQYAGEVKVLGRATGDGVMLRWAPTNYIAWNYGNQYGYQVVRYRFDGDGEQMFKDSVILTPTPIQPLPLAGWEPLAKKNRYAAITAQALYGESFQLDEESDAGQAALLNKNTEQQNRFAFALASADQSLEVAEASGLYYEDNNIEPGVTYVYRVRLAHQHPSLRIQRGSIIINPSEVEPLPTPADLEADYGDASVRLHWNSFFNRNIYNYYVIERSEDGKNYQRLNELNFLQLRNNSSLDDYNLYYMDSLKNEKMYYYRVKGINAFGEAGPPSNVVSGKAHQKIGTIPGIKSGKVDGAGKAQIHWFFPDSLENRIKGFYIAQAVTSKGPFKNVHNKIIPASERYYSDPNPMATNYYVVRAESRYGEMVESMPLLVQTEDSIPPLPPVGLQGVIDSTGQVTIRWNKNTERDFDGYKVFKSYYKDREYVQAHDNLVYDTMFTEKVQLRNLTKDYYYQVAAVDRRSNASDFSTPILVIKPDVVAPTAPILQVPKYKEGTVTLSWIEGSDDDLEGYNLFRQGTDSLVLLSHLQKGVTQYQDLQVAGGVQYIYSIVSVDQSGLTSDTASYSISIPDNGILPPVKKITYQVDFDNRKLTLKWKYDVKDIDGFILYRSLDEGALRMLDYITPQEAQYVERNYKIGRIYKYRVQAYKGEYRSPLSEWIKPVTN